MHTDQMPSSMTIYGFRFDVRSGNVPCFNAQDNLLRRAFFAYRRNGYFQPSQSGSTVESYKDKLYVVLRNVGGTLAVYRVKNDGRLRDLKRWPKAID